MNVEPDLIQKLDIEMTGIRMVKSAIDIHDSRYADLVILELENSQAAQYCESY